MIRVELCGRQFLARACRGISNIGTDRMLSPVHAQPASVHCIYVRCLLRGERGRGRGRFMSPLGLDEGTSKLNS